MQQYITRWNQVSIRLKVMTWVIVILLVVAASVGVSVLALNVMIRDY